MRRVLTVESHVVPRRHVVRVAEDLTDPTARGR